MQDLNFAPFVRSVANEKKRQRDSIIKNGTLRERATRFHRSEILKITKVFRTKLSTAHRASFLS